VGAPIEIDFCDTVDGHDKQGKAWKSDARFLSLLWGRRAGKDWIAHQKAIKNTYRDFNAGLGETNCSLSKKLPRLHYWAVAPTYALSKTQIMYFLSTIPDKLIQKNNVFSRGELWLYPEILWEFKSGERPETLVSVGLNGMYITETARLKKNVWNDNLRPTLSDKGGWCIDTTTPIGNNWYIDDIWRFADPNSADKQPDHEGIFCKSIENTMVPELIADIEKARVTMPKKYFLRNYEASIDAFHGQIYDEYNREVHVQDFKIDLERYKVVVAGVDWGYTHHGGFILIGITDDDSVDVFHEDTQDRIPCVSSDSDADTWAKRALAAQEKYDVELFYCGVDEPEHIKAFRNEGVSARKCKNEVSPGIQAVSTLMKIDNNGHTRLRIHPSCKRLVKYLPAYKWAENREGDASEKPDKVNDDECDMLRYAIYSAHRYIGLHLPRQEDEQDELKAA